VYSAVFILFGTYTLWDIPVLCILGGAGTGFYFLIRRGLGRMRIPVIVYIVVISWMVSRAFSAFSSPVLSNQQAWMISTGAVLFYISDVILAANQFWKSWKYQRISLIFYYSGQWLIALSAGSFV
jgi:uncharacterized membrane protein YhhN